MSERAGAEQALGDVRAHVMGALRSLSQVAVALTAQGDPVRKGNGTVDIPVSVGLAARIAHCSEMSIARAIQGKRLKVVPARRVVGGVEYGIYESQIHEWMQNRAKTGRPPKSRNGAAP